MAPKTASCDWAEFLAGPTERDVVERIRKHTHSRIPLGSRDFVERLEKRPGEPLTWRRTGRPREEKREPVPVCKKAAETGGAIPAGAHIGDVVKWLEGVEGFPDQIDVSDGKRFDHLHLNMVIEDAKGGEHFYNVGKYLAYQDTIKPTVEAVHFVPDGGSKAAFGAVPVVSGKVDVVIEAFDRINGWQKTDGHLVERPHGSPFKLGIYRSEVTVRSASDDKEVFRTELPPFDEVTTEPGGYTGDSAKKLYLREVQIDGKAVRARGDRFGRRNFLVATNAEPRTWGWKSARL